MPTWNGAQFLDRVMAALAAQQLALPWEFLAIDSGSADRTLEVLEAWRARFPVPMRVQHIHPTAFNHGDTRNLLAAESTGELLVYLTQDAIPSSPDWLQRLVGHFTDAGVGAAYCRNVPRPDAAVLTRVFSEHDPGYATERREQKLPDVASYEAMNPHERRLLFNLNNVAAAYRRELWERHPFPRTEFGEDVLMARALIEAGYTVVYDNVATVEHSHDYGPAEMRARARIDGQFNAEWLDRICVASRRDAAALTRRQLARDRTALIEAGLTGTALTGQLEHARALREAAFVGLYEGGRTRVRRAPTRMRDSGRLRILYVVHGFPPDTWAGTEVYTLGLALEMQRRGHDVAVLARAPAHTEAAHGGPADFELTADEVRGLRVWRLTNRLRHENLRRTYQQPRAEAAFRQVVREFRPDVVHFQHLLHLSAALPHACRELGIASIVTVNDYWALCPRVQLIRPDGVRCETNQGLGCLLCVKEGPYPLIPAARRLLPLLAPAAAVLRRADVVPGLARAARLAGEYGDIAARHAFVTGGYAACDLAIAPSRFLRDRLLETGRFEPHRVIYSDYGTVTDHIRPIPRRLSAIDGIRFGYVGSLLWYKGVDVLIRAMSRLAGLNAVLHIHGDFRPDSDPYHATLAELAGACGGSVIFHGRFDNRELTRVYETFDALVVPSTWFENSPITIHESFLFRTPVITSDIGGMAELVRDGADGLHFRAGDAGDLAAKLARLATEPDLLPGLTQFRHVRSMEEDASEMEVRYRGLACIIRETGPRTLVDRPGWPATAHGGPVEQQGADLALLRPGGAWVEYEMQGIGPGRFAIRIDVQAFAAEGSVPLGGGAFIDGVQVGVLVPFAAGGRDEIRQFTFEVDLLVPARRLRLNTQSGSDELFMRVARVAVTGSTTTADAAPGVDPPRPYSGSQGRLTAT
jgi:glycosyltransferase involved in cell wall biosynthesis